MQLSSSSGSLVGSLNNQTKEPDNIADFAEERLRQLIRAGNVEAIKLGLSLRPQTMEISC